MPLTGNLSTVDRESTTEPPPPPKNDHRPYYVILRVKEDGKVYGVVEHGFGMGDSTATVRLWWSGKAYSMLGEHNISGKEDAEYNARLPGDVVFNLDDPDCPITIDTEKWQKVEGSEANKYAKRNPPFIVKPLGKYVIQAMVLARQYKQASDLLQALQGESVRLERIRSIANGEEP